MRIRHFLRRNFSSFTAPSKMASSTPIHQGVFAINKPPGISSAQVIRDLQSHFTPSALFAPWLAREAAHRHAESHNQRQKRRSWKQRQAQQVKLGHGGTLDPMATGVLIVGVGDGTKALSRFLECTKSYECVLLFGAETDTYDAVGKVVARAPFVHITREMVEKAVEGFKGKIMQRPPIFSALRVQGKRLYEYAREGKEVPVEIQERPVEVEKLEVLEWMEGGSHAWNWPSEEAGTEEKAIVQKVLRQEGEGISEANPVAAGTKRKEREDDTPNDLPDEAEEEPSPLPKRRKLSSPSQPSHPSDQTTSETSSCPAPAIRLSMTVTSGFYVRSLCHDLGAAVGSAGLMAKLVRTRQGDFEVGRNVIEYDDLATGEEMWGPKVKEMLEGWAEKEGGGQGAADGERKVAESVGGENGAPRSGEERKKLAKPAMRAKMRRRNTSSSEDGDGG